MVTVVGTDLGTARSDIPWQGVKIDGVSCDIVNHTYQPGVRYYSGSINRICADSSVTSFLNIASHV